MLTHADVFSIVPAFVSALPKIDDMIAEADKQVCV
jgi:hypothetical protein